MFAMPETAREQIEPRLRQVSFFLPNRLGSLRKATRLLEEHQIRIGGIVVMEATDHAVIRVIVDKPDAAYETLVAEGYGGCVTEVLGVAVPVGQRAGIQRMLGVLLGAEVNLAYAYGLMLHSDGEPIVALQADDLTAATRVLQQNGFLVVGQDHLSWPRGPVVGEDRN
jgi:hypothetical protein